MRELVRWSVVVIVVAHGLIHLLGAAKGSGWAEVSAVKQSIGPAMDACWVAAALVVTVTGVLLGVEVRSGHDLGRRPAVMGWTVRWGSPMVPSLRHADPRDHWGTP